MKDVTAINWIRKARRVALRFAGKVAAQELAQDDLDLAMALFGDPKTDNPLVACGLVADPDLGLEDVSDRFAALMLTMLEREATDARLAAMRKVIKARLVAARGKPSDRRMPEGFDPDRISPEKLGRRSYPKRQVGVLLEASEKAVAAADERDASIAAVHLFQRALYVGMSRALVRLADEQNREVPGRLCGHSPVKFGEDKAASADAWIKKWLRGGRHRKSVGSDASQGD